MSPYITFKDTNENGELTLYICQREYPHFCGELADRPIVGAIIQVPISGHNLWLTFFGTLRGRYLPAERGIDQQITAVFHDMAIWFYMNRIQKEPKRYKKWLIPV